MIDKDELRKILPQLIREDDAIRGAIIAALSGVIATRDDIKDLIGEMDKRFGEMDKRFEAMQKQMDQRFTTLQEHIDKRFEMVIQEIADTNRNVGLLKTFLGNKIDELRSGQQRVEKFMREIREWMQSRDE